MTRLSTLQDVNNALLLKTLNMAVFVAPSSADTIDETQLFDQATGDLKTLPTGYMDVGSTTVDGAQFSRAISTSSVTILQSLAPGRIDVTGDEITMQVVCDETKLPTMGLATGADFTGITGAANGAVRVDKPKTPPKRTYRVFAISEDLSSAGQEIFVCRYLPNAMITSYGNQSFARGDNTIQTDVTFTAQLDSTLGTDHSWIWGGIGWKALATAAGLTDAS